MQFKKVVLTGLCLFLISSQLFAQDEDSTVVEDFSLYADFDLADGAKRYCTSKVLDLSPSKLISVGYDFQGSHDMELGEWGSLPARTVNVRSVQGIRLAGNFPIISRTNVLLNLGVGYSESHYDIEADDSHPLPAVLESRALRATNITATLFKPLNETNFFLLQSLFDLNGDYFLPDFQDPGLTRISATLIYGWKKHDRLMYGFGFSRTYRIGELNYIPVFLYNYTGQSRKWGVEAVFPARANVRRTINKRTLAFFGYELEGNTYRLSALENIQGITNPELRRSELRIRLTFEKALKDFIWISAQAGLRYNWNINVDDGDFFRGFTGDQDYAFENDLSNALYFNVSLNLVSP